MVLLFESCEVRDQETTADRNHSSSKTLFKWCLIHNHHHRGAEVDMEKKRSLSAR